MSKTVRFVMSFCTVVGVLQAWSSSLQAGIVFYTAEAAFDAAAPALQNQDFASANVTMLSVIGNSLNNATNTAVFGAGSILPGLSFFSSSSHGSQDLGVVAAGVFGNPVKAVYNNFAGDSLDVGFGPMSVAVGMGVLNPSGDNVKVIVLGSGGTILASQTFTVPSNGAEQFIGAIATGGDQISQIDLLGGGGPEVFAGLDRVSFAPVDAAPEPSALVQGVIAASMIALGTWRRARAK